MTATSTRSTSTSSANGRSDLVRKLVPDFRTPASVGRARRGRQDPDPGIADHLDLLAVVSFATKELLSGRLASKCKKSWTKRHNRIAQTLAIRRRQFWKRCAVHPCARFHQVGQADPVLRQVAILMRLQQLGSEVGLVQNPPELVLPVRVVRTGGGGCRPRGSAAQHDLKRILQQVTQDVRHGAATGWAPPTP